MSPSCVFIKANEPRLISFNEYLSEDGTTSIQVYGMPSDDVLGDVAPSGGIRVPLNVKPHHLGGFTRP